MKKFKAFIIVAVAATFFAACNISVNKSIDIRSGETREGGAHTVNGSITIGDDCTIKGSCRTVNGSVEAGKNCRLRDLDTVNSCIVIGDDTEVDGDVETVNGGLDLGKNVRISGDISTTNGDIVCKDGVKIQRNARNVNGDITLSRTAIAGNLKTHTGSIFLTNSSTVGGDIIIGHSSGFIGKKGRIDIHIDSTSAVKGHITVKTKRFEVVVHLAKGAVIGGEVTGARVEKES